MELVSLTIFGVLLNTLRAQEYVGTDEQICATSELEENIRTYNAQKPRIFLPRLKDLRKLYPDDVFKDSDQKECFDLESNFVCSNARKQGNCNGTNHKVRLTHSNFQK